jgi:hypothetical protein
MPHAAEACACQFTAVRTRQGVIADCKSRLLELPSE